MGNGKPKPSAASQGGDDLDKGLQDRLKALLQEKSTIKELYAANLAYGKSIGMSKEEVNKVNLAYGHQTRLINDIVKLAEKGAKLKNGELATERDVLAIRRLAKNLDEGQLDIVRGRVQASADLAKAHIMLQTGLEDEYAEQVLQLQAALKMGAISEQNFQTAVKKLHTDQEQVKEIKKQKEFISEIARKQEEILEQSNEYKKKFEGYLASFKAITSSPAMLASAAVVGLTKAGEEFSEVYKELKAEGLSVGQSFHETITSFTDSLSTGFLVSGKSIREARKAIIDTGGTLHDAEEAGKDAAEMAEKFGGSVSNAGKALGQLQKIPGMTKEAAKNTAEFGAKLSIAAGVPADTVTKAVAENMDAAAIAGPKMQESLSKAAINAQKLGVQFSTIEGIASKLLDFEGSINAQMEASVLLGREINLDKAREYANAGDYAKLQEEILKNVGSEAEFTKMSRIQKEKLAAAMGVSVGDLAKMVKGQGELTDLAKEQGEAAEEQNGTLALIGNKLAENMGTVVGALGSAASMVMQYMMQKRHTAAITNELRMQTAEMQKQNAVKGKGAGKGALGGKDMSKDAGKAAGGSDKVKTGGGFKKAMGDLAAGFKKMGDPKVLAGVGVTALAGPALLLAIPAIPFLLFMGMTPLKQLAINFKGLASGLSAMGSGKAAAGALVLMLAAAASAVGILGIPFLLTMSIIGPGLAVGLTSLATGLSALANPMVAIGVGLLSVLVLSVGAGVMMLGIGIGIAAAGMSLFVASLSTLPFDSLAALPIALYGIASGLGAMTMAGVGAIPVIGALIALANVAPALTSLASALSGMGGGGAEEDKMDTLIAEIRSLKAEIAKGGVVNMDGRKVGEVVRLAMNTTGVR
jgi:hypothetical protein